MRLSGFCALPLDLPAPIMRGLLARRSAEIIYKSFQDPGGSAGVANSHRNASNFGHFTIIMQSQESPSHSIFGAIEARKQMTMEMRPSGAHGSGAASDPGPALNRSGCIKTCPAM